MVSEMYKYNNRNNNKYTEYNVSNYIFNNQHNV